jgi:soluble lytic murein transglycosylase
MASLIRVESAGDPNIVSRVGAIGLTQIMPATGREIARDLKIADYSTEMLYHPETNIRMGSYYLRKLLNRFDGDLHAALAAYNWGPHHIAMRISRQQALPVQYPGKILKRIPEQPNWVVASKG